MKSPLVLLALLAPISGLQAAIITGAQTSATEWTYDLTFTTSENYSIFQPATTIRLTGLFGVTAATPPTSTDFPVAWLDELNLQWIPTVLNGGTEVQWTHIGSGTGNFPDEKHIYGFRVVANGAYDGLVTLTTSGFSRDTSDPLPDGTFNLDTTGLVSGPVAVPEPGSATAFFAFGLVGLSLCRIAHRLTFLDGSRSRG